MATRESRAHTVTFVNKSEFVAAIYEDIIN